MTLNEININEDLIKEVYERLLGVTKDYKDRETILGSLILVVMNTILTSTPKKAVQKTLKVFIDILKASTDSALQTMEQLNIARDIEELIQDLVRRAEKNENNFGDDDEI